MAKTFEPFPAAACQRLRNLVELKKKSEGERKRMFGVRDQAVENRAQALQNNQPKKVEKSTEEYGQAILEIKRLDKEVRWCDGEIMEAVEKADQPGLFTDVDIAVPDFRPGMAHEEEDDDEDQQTMDARPVGRPGKKPPAAPDPATGDGVDEHLKASVNELDVPEAIIGKLHAAKYERVDQVVRLLESKQLDPRECLNLDEKQIGLLQAAVKKFRGKHQKAIKDEALAEAKGTGIAKPAGPERVGRGAGKLKLAE